MKSGELKDTVTEIIQREGESSVKDVLDIVEDTTGKEYAYTTIATILKRLEEDGVLQSEKKKLDGRKKRYYAIRENASKEKAESFLNSFVKKFGKVGVRHLGEVINSDFSEDEIEELRQMLADS